MLKGRGDNTGMCKDINMEKDYEGYRREESTL
jgi:hypothetical protein